MTFKKFIGLLMIHGGASLVAYLFFSLLAAGHSFNESGRQMEWETFHAPHPYILLAVLAFNVIALGIHFLPAEHD